MIAAISREPMTRTVSETTLIHIHRDQDWVGAMFLDEHDRLYLCDPDIPQDVALKALVAHTRQGKTHGLLTADEDGRPYSWCAVRWDGR
jgi:hypothetical protein